MTYFNILLPLSLEQPFTYESDLNLKTGDIVLVPFRKRELVGVVWEENIETSSDKIKSVLKSFDARLSPNHLKFLEKCALYNFQTLGETLRQFLSGADFEKKPREIEFLIQDYSLHALNAEQENAHKALSVNHYQTFLLDGVTGSGKTEVYFHTICDVLKSGKQVLVLQPEIALSTTWMQRFEKSFHHKALLWHSGVTPAKKRDIWNFVRNQNTGVIVGARSALFLPFNNLGLIIVDEEHDSSYKQEERFIYSARDMAVLRGSIENCPVVLCSATPSIETWNNIELKKYEHVRIHNRFQNAKLPNIQLIDLNEEPVENFLSEKLLGKLRENFEKNEQSLLFLNRKGYAPLTICKSCRHRVCCINCDLNLVEHRNPKRLVCHYCGFIQKYPKTCQKCKEEDSYVPWGPGIHKIEEILKEKIPTARIRTITGDESYTFDEWQTLLGEIIDHKIDIVLGTQILAKGHHFPKLTLVGVIDGDFSLNTLDLRSAERTYQILCQVSGRAGREGDESFAYIQTHNTESPVLKSFMNNDRDSFLESERNLRKKNLMPPFSFYIGLLFSGKVEKEVEQFAKKVTRFIYEHFKNDLQIFGPIPAPLSFLNKKYRFRVLLKSSKNPMSLNSLRKSLVTLKTPSTINMQINVDPYSFL